LVRCLLDADSESAGAAAVGALAAELAAGVRAPNERVNRAPSPNAADSSQTHRH
jgi:hypothetical protein